MKTPWTLGPPQPSRRDDAGRRVDLAMLLTGPVAEDIRSTPGMRLMASPLGIFWLDFPDQWDPKSPWADRRVRPAASLAIDRQALNEAETLGLSGPTGNTVPRDFEFALPIDRAPSTRPAPKSSWPRLAIRTASRAVS